MPDTYVNKILDVFRTGITNILGVDVANISRVTDVIWSSGESSGETPPDVPILPEPAMHYDFLSTIPDSSPVTVPQVGSYTGFNLQRYVLSGELRVDDIQRNYWEVTNIYFLPVFTTTAASGQDLTKPAVLSFSFKRHTSNMMIEWTIANYPSVKLCVEFYGGSNIVSFRLLQSDSIIFTGYLTSEIDELVTLTFFIANDRIFAYKNMTYLSVDYASLLTSFPRDVLTQYACSCALYDYRFYKALNNDYIMDSTIRSSWAQSIYDEVRTAELEW